MIGPYSPNSIITGDARELTKEIPDGSIDLIFTDPPYLKEYLYLYEWLYWEAKRILKASGFVLAYAGNYWKDEIFSMARAAGMKYFWDYQTIMNTGSNSIIWPRRTIAIAKSILAHRVGEGMPRTNVLGAYSGGEQDKRYHVWGQDEATARYYIDCFAGPGSIVFDPFAGGGTTALAARVLGLDYLAFEVDEETATKARLRLKDIQPVLFATSAQTVMAI